VSADRAALIDAAAKAAHALAFDHECWTECAEWERDIYRECGSAVLDAVVGLIADAIEAHAGKPDADGIRAGVSAWPRDKAVGYSVAVDEFSALVRSLGRGQ